MLSNDAVMPPAGLIGKPGTAADDVLGDDKPVSAAGDFSAEEGGGDWWRSCQNDHSTPRRCALRFRVATRREVSANCSSWCGDFEWPRHAKEDQDDPHRCGRKI